MFILTLQRCGKKQSLANSCRIVLQPCLIILQLNPKAQVEQHSAYVPDQLNEIIAELKLFIEETGLQVTEIINIQYAKKIRARLGQKESEVNLFYGKRGFSIVISPRLGTNEELNELLADLVKTFLQK